MTARRKKSKQDASKDFVTSLRKGDVVMVIAGGNKEAGKVMKGQTGSILRLLPKRNRVVVEGVNIIKKHKKARTSTDSAGIIQKEGPIHISNVMYYSADLKRPVRIKFKRLEDGRKVRGFLNPKTSNFEQIDI